MAILHHYKLLLLQMKKQNELIKTKGDELEAQKNRNNSIIAEVKRLEEDAKQKEFEHDKQKLQQELNKKKEES